MQRREFITAAAGMAAAVASASQAFAQDYPDIGAIKKMPVGEGVAGAAKKGIEGEAGAAKKGVKGVIEKITEAIGGGEMEEMHPPKYKALEDSAAKCVVTGNESRSRHTGALCNLLCVRPLAVRLPCRVRGLSGWALVAFRRHAAGGSRWLGAYRNRGVTPPRSRSRHLSA